MQTRQQWDISKNDDQCKTIILGPLHCVFEAAITNWQATGRANSHSDSLDHNHRILETKADSDLETGKVDLVSKSILSSTKPNNNNKEQKEHHKG